MNKLSTALVQLEVFIKVKPVIEQLFDGEINANEHFSWTDDYRKYTHNFSKVEEEFLKFISKSEEEIYDKLKGMRSHCSVIESKIHFTYGFKLGFQLANEILEKANFNRY